MQDPVGRQRWDKLALKQMGNPETRRWYALSPMNNVRTASNSPMSWTEHIVVAVLPQQCAVCYDSKGETIHKLVQSISRLVRTRVGPHSKAPLLEPTVLPIILAL